MQLLSFTLSLIMLFVWLLPCRAFADPGAEADFLWSTYGFTSPGNAYGQRNAQELRARLHLASDSPGIDVLNQNDANPAFPQHGQYITIDDYHQFRDGSFGYLSLGAGSGNSVPLHNLYAEMDLKVLRSTPLVFGLGGDVTSSSDGVVERYLSVGPTYYFNGGDVTLRYMPTSVSNGTASSSGEFSLELGPNSRRSMLLLVQYGNSPPFLAQNGIIVAGVSQRAVDVDLVLKNRIRGNLRILCGFDFTHVVDAANGNPMYTRRGLSLGVERFVDRKVGI